jgi:hypothetical protein
LPDDVTLGFVLSEFAWIRGDGMDGWTGAATLQF